MTRKNLFLLIIIIILSLLGGIIGGIIVRSYLINSSFGLPVFGDINLGKQNQNGSIVISQPKKVIVEQNDRVTDVITEGRKSLVSFYREKVINMSAKDVVNLNQFYFPKDKISEGLVLTNDGWIITLAKLDKNFIAIDHENKILEIEDTIFDKETGYHFVKLKASNLVAVQFAEKNNIKDGQILVSLNLDNNSISYIQNSNYFNDLNGIKSSEKLYRLIKIDKDLNKSEVQFNLDGSVVGLYSEKNLVKPIKNFTLVLTNLLNNQKIARPALGINYISLAGLKGEQEADGAYIRSFTNIRNNPALIAKLKVGEVILEVDGVKVDENNTLSELIQDLKVNEKVELSILRAGKEEKIEVELGEK